MPYRLAIPHIRRKWDLNPRHVEQDSLKNNLQIIKVTPLKTTFSFYPLLSGVGAKTLTNIIHESAVML